MAQIEETAGPLSAISVKSGPARMQIDQLQQKQLADRQRVDDSIELLTDARRKNRRGSADASGLIAAVEIMRPVQRHIIRRAGLSRWEKQSQPQLGSIELGGAATDSLHAGVGAHWFILL